MPMGDMIRRTAGRVPDKIAFIMDDKSLSYGDLNRRINRLANGLLRMGLRKGDRVAVLTHNCIEFYEIYLALCKTGGVMVPVNNLLKQREFRQIVDYIKPRFLFYQAELKETVETYLSSGGSVELLVCLGGDPAGRDRDYETLLAEGGEEEPPVQVFPHDLMSIFLTSGTTGRPKGAMRTHQHNYVNAVTATIEMGLGNDDRVLLLFPFYHITFEDRFCHLLMGNTVVICREGSFNPAEVLSLLSRHRITICQFVPTMINTMLQEKGIETHDLDSLRLILYAAAPMPVELLKKAMRLFKCGFMQFYGQTESGPMTTILKPEDHKLEGTEEEVGRLASCGRPVLDFETRIVGLDGNDVPVGEVGELLVRSEAMTVGYWDLPEETAATLAGGWLHTGDFARMDGEGYIYIVDRKNDMIISGGKNIYPREIEEVLYAHPAVLEASVIGIPDDHWGESVKAVVVIREGDRATEEELIGFCKENLASYKKPRSVEFRDALPKSPTGKILKRVLRDEFWEGRSRKV